MIDAEALWRSFVMLFLVLDPVGNVPLFFALTSGFSEEEREKVFAESVLVASALLVAFVALGPPLLERYGVEMSDFKVAGGLVLLLVALMGMFGRLEAEQLRGEAVAVVPMATPLLAGPGSMYTVVYLARVYGFAPALLSVALNTAAAYFILRASRLILRKVGRNAILALARVLSLLLAAIAVSLIRSGVAEALAELSRPRPAG